MKGRFRKSTTERIREIEERCERSRVSDEQFAEQVSSPSAQQHSLRRMLRRHRQRLV